MKRAGKTIAVLLGMILTTASMALAQQQPTPDMSYRHAQRVIMRAMPYGRTWNARSGMRPLDQNSVRLTQGTLEFDAEGEHFTIALGGIRKQEFFCDKDLCFVNEKNGYNSLFLTEYNAKKRKVDIHFALFCSWAQYHDECITAAAQFVAALNSLHIYALRPMLSDEDFQKQAAAWRALTEKPALPDAARVRRLLAEDAIKNKKPEEALTFYEQALEAYPTWPEGWFNSALVAGELGRYDDAVDDMQNYLELMPDAKDAQTARDQMEMWKIRAQTKK